MTSNKIPGSIKIGKIQLVPKLFSGSSLSTWRLGVKYVKSNSGPGEECQLPVPFRFRDCYLRGTQKGFTKSFGSTTKKVQTKLNRFRQGGGTKTWALRAPAPFLSGFCGKGWIALAVRGRLQPESNHILQKGFVQVLFGTSEGWQAGGRDRREGAGREGFRLHPTGSSHWIQS